WTSENIPDADTLALYHFNEAFGTTADNAQGSASRDLTLSSPSMITTGTDFLGRTSQFLNMSFGQAVSAAQAIPTNWSQGLTISFWMKTSSQTDGDRYPVWLSDGLGYRNEAGFGYHPGWSYPYRPKMQNVGRLYGDINDINGRLLNGAWHHVAITHSPSDNQAKLYIDNQLMDGWSDNGTDLASGATLYVGQWFSGIDADVDELLIQRGTLTDFSTQYIGVNSPPVANPDTYTVVQNRQLNVPAPGILSNDYDPDGDPLTPFQMSNTSHGTVTNFGSGGFTYNPTADYLGIDSFTYRDSDGSLFSNTTTVTINVVPNHAPVGGPDTYSTTQNKELTVPASNGVLINDTDEDKDKITATNPTAPSQPHGTLTQFNTDGSFTYKPDIDWIGTDTFTY